MINFRLKYLEGPEKISANEGSVFANGSLDSRAELIQFPPLSARGLWITRPVSVCLGVWFASLGLDEPELRVLNVWR
jgi:hypothetical protein